MAPVFIEAPVDSPAARELLAEYFEERIAGFDTTTGSYRVTHPDPAAFVAPRGVFLVVEDGGEAVGCGGVRMLDAGRAEIKHLYLRDSTRGRGFGRMLLAGLEDRAGTLGATVAVLDTNATLTAAGGLSRAAGYSEPEPYNDNPNATLWFRKDL